MSADSSPGVWRMALVLLLLSILGVVMGTCIGSAGL